MKPVKVLSIMTAVFVFIAILGGGIAELGLSALPLVLILIGLIGGLISGIALIVKLVTD